MEKRNSYVYVYLDPRKPGEFRYPNLNFLFEFEPFYVGKGFGNRYLLHLRVAQNTQVSSHRHNKIRKILSLDLNPIIVKVYDGISDQRAVELEIHTIRAIGRLSDPNNPGPLTNFTDGGQGLLGMKHSEETRRKISESNTGDAGTYTLTEEWKQKISLGSLRAIERRQTYQKIPKSLPPEIHDELERAILKRPGQWVSQQGSGNGNATFYYILLSPTGVFHFIDRGCLSPRCKEIGVSPWSMVNAARWFERTGVLYVAAKGVNHGWTAVRFTDPSKNPFGWNNGQSAAKPHGLDEEGSETISTESTS